MKTFACLHAVAIAISNDAVQRVVNTSFCLSSVETTGSGFSIREEILFLVFCLERPGKKTNSTNYKKPVNLILLTSKEPSISFHFWYWQAKTRKKCPRIYTFSLTSISLFFDFQKETFTLSSSRHRVHNVKSDPRPFVNNICSIWLADLWTTTIPKAYVIEELFLMDW